LSIANLSVFDWLTSLAANWQSPITNRQSQVCQGQLLANQRANRALLLALLPLSGINGDAPRLSGFGVQMARERAMKISKKLAP
jgi:hypothetical protein